MRRSTPVGTRKMGGLVRHAKITIKDSRAEMERIVAGCHACQLTNATAHGSNRTVSMKTRDLDLDMEILNQTKGFCVLVQLLPKIIYHSDEQVLQWFDAGTHRQDKREPISAITIATLLGIGLAAAGTGLCSQEGGESRRRLRRKPAAWPGGGAEGRGDGSRGAGAPGRKALLLPSRGETLEPRRAQEGAARSGIRELPDAWAHRTRGGTTAQTWGTGGDILGAPAKLVPRAGVVLATRRVVCASVSNPVGQQVHGLGSAGTPLAPQVRVHGNPGPFSAAGSEGPPARTTGRGADVAESRGAAGSWRPSAAGPPRPRGAGPREDAEPGAGLDRGLGSRSLRGRRHRPPARRPEAGAACPAPRGRAPAAACRAPAARGAAASPRAQVRESSEVMVTHWQMAMRTARSPVTIRALCQAAWGASLVQPPPPPPCILPLPGWGETSAHLRERSRD
ncbi:uncharacterized protein AAEQ78_004883 [Lycaon pictus]